METKLKWNFLRLPIVTPASAMVSRLCVFASLVAVLRKD